GTSPPMVIWPPTQTDAASTCTNSRIMDQFGLSTRPTLGHRHRSRADALASEDSSARQGGEHVAGGQAAVVHQGTPEQRAAEQGSRGSFDRALEVADVPWGREVLVFVGDPDDLDALCRRQAVEDGLDELLGGRRAGGDTDHAGQIVRQLVGTVDAVHAGAAALAG